MTTFEPPLGFQFRHFHAIKNIPERLDFLG